MLRWMSRQWQELSSDWDRFWFSPVDPALVGVLRILTGLMLIYTHAVWGINLHDFFGSHSWLSPELAAQLQQGDYSFSYLWWVSDEWLWPAHVAAGFVLVAFTCGIFTRATAVLSYVILVSYAGRAPAALFGLDQINGMLTLYLTIGYLATPAAARALSVDRLWHQRRSLAGGSCTANFRHSVPANFTLRLIQIHMCVIYFFAGISKLRGDAWWDGDAMWLAFANEEYRSLNMMWTARIPWLLSIMAHTTVAWEISFPALVWFRRTRPLVLFVGVLLHLGIGAFLGMWTFGLIMIIGYSSFVPPDLVGEWFRRIRRRGATLQLDNEASAPAAEWDDELAVPVGVVAGGDYASDEAAEVRPRNPK